MRSLPTCASHCLKGSDLGEGIDWMMRRMPFVVAVWDLRIFPSGASSLSGVQIVPHLELSSESLERIF